jgi:hypothetical protein
MAWEFSRIRCSWGTAPFLVCQKIQDICHNADHLLFSSGHHYFLVVIYDDSTFSFPFPNSIICWPPFVFASQLLICDPFCRRVDVLIFYIKKLYLNLICRRVFLVQMKRSFNYYFLVWGFFIPSKKNNYYDNCFVVEDSWTLQYWKSYKLLLFNYIDFNIKF